MFLKALLIVFLPKSMLFLILSPSYNDVMINSSLELTCYAPENCNFTKWSISTKDKLFSPLMFVEEGKCSVDNFLSDNQYFETRCYRNATFKVKIKRINMTNHGQEWYCYYKSNKSNSALIKVVEVPTKYVKFKDNPGEIIQTIEKRKSKLICETSKGIPAANITWSNVSRYGNRTSLINVLAYTYPLQVDGMTIVTSRIDIEPKREDNGTRIICRATNSNWRQTVTKEITMHVQYPPNWPILSVNGDKVNDSVTFFSGQNKSVFCESDSYPTALYRWSTDKDYIIGQYLNLSTLNKSETWKCTATNNMTLLNGETIHGQNSSTVNLNALSSPIASLEFDMKTNISSAKNSNITFRFKAFANPLPEFRWFRKIGPSWIIINGSNRHEIRTIDKDSSLTVKNVTDDDYGCYKVRIQNQAGSIEQVYHLNVNGQPDPPSIFQHLTEHVTETTAVLQWTPGFDGGPDQTFILRYKLDLESDWVNVSIPDLGDKTMNYTLDDLESDAVYNTELYAVNIEGKSKILTDTFRTKEFITNNRKSVLTLMYVLYSIGGVILLGLMFLATTIIRRKLKQKSSRSVIYQNVQMSAAGSINIYQNLPLSTQTTVKKVNVVLPTRKVDVKETQKPNEMPPNNETPASHNHHEFMLDFDEHISEALEYVNTLDIIKTLKNEINVTELYDYINGETDETISVDFQKIPTGFQKSCTFARKPKNIALNRYKDILPYDQTRVRIDDQPEFFINASYIDGYIEPKEYIACLGPTAATHDNFKTFWKMVWCERSELIVMVTNLNEPSGMKCGQYWPDENQDEMYGEILVSYKKMEKFAEHTIRRFKLTRTTKAGKVFHNLIHLHYTAWPDKKTPEDVTSFLEFRQAFNDIRTTVSGPLIIHCSAGIGRTGVFIATDKLIMEGKNEGSVNVVACITKMREQRVRMVQTSEQYTFIFQTLAYALNFDCKPIPIEHFTQQLESEMSNDGQFDRQYKELNLPLEGESKDRIDCREKNRSYKDKNRHGADIPDNKNRVYLYLYRGYEDSDYINAVFINSYKCKDHFIMAQSPLPGTESDFLTMIYQENCFCVISMDDYIEHGMKMGKYILRENQSFDIGNFTLSCFLIDLKQQYMVRKVTIKNSDEISKGERYFYHFQYKAWIAENDIPLYVEEFVDFVEDVQEYAELGDDSSHVLAHCVNANERSGLFCAIAIIREKLVFDEQVSILNTLRHLRTRRPSAITSLDQLKFCYKAAVAMAEKQHERIYINDPNMISKPNTGSTKRKYLKQETC